MTTQQVPAVAVRSVVKTFQRGGTAFNAVNNTSWHADHGEIVAFLGENGAGKSTTIDMILGLTTPNSGTIEIFGELPHQAIRRGRIGALLQQNTLPPDATVTEVLGMIAATYAPRAIDLPQLLADWKLTDCARTRIARCSGGQIQRLRCALAVMNRPDLLVLDEPTTGMDPTARAAFWQHMHSQAGTGRTVVFATHYLAEAEEFADRIVIISNGVIVADDSTSAIRQRMGRAEVTAELSDPEDVRLLTAHLSTHGHGELTRDGEHVRIATHDSDAVARYLLTHTQARHLTITQARLEDIFTALTTHSGQNSAHPANPAEAPAASTDAPAADPNTPASASSDEEPRR